MPAEFGSAIKITFDSTQAASALNSLIQTIGQLNTGLRTAAEQSSSTLAPLYRSFDDARAHGVAAADTIQTAFNSIQFTALHARIESVQQQFAQLIISARTAAAQINASMSAPGAPVSREEFYAAAPAAWGRRGQAWRAQQEQPGDYLSPMPRRAPNAPFGRPPVSTDLSQYPLVKPLEWATMTARANSMLSQLPVGFQRMVSGISPYSRLRGLQNWNDLPPELRWGGSTAMGSGQVTLTPRSLIGGNRSIENTLAHELGHMMMTPVSFPQHAPAFFQRLGLSPEQQAAYTQAAQQARLTTGLQFLGRMPITGGKPMGLLPNLEEYSAERLGMSGIRGYGSAEEMTGLRAPFRTMTELASSGNPAFAAMFGGSLAGGVGLQSDEMGDLLGRLRGFVAPSGPNIPPVSRRQLPRTDAERRAMASRFFAERAQAIIGGTVPLPVPTGNDTIWREVSTTRRGQPLQMPGVGRLTRLQLTQSPDDYPIKGGYLDLDASGVPVRWQVQRRPGVDLAGRPIYAGIEEGLTPAASRWGKLPPNLTRQPWGDPTIYEPTRMDALLNRRRLASQDYLTTDTAGRKVEELTRRWNTSGKELTPLIKRYDELGNVISNAGAKAENTMNRLSFGRHLSYFATGTLMYMTLGTAIQFVTNSLGQAVKGASEFEAAQARVGFIMSRATTDTGYVTTASQAVGTQTGVLPSEIASGWAGAAQTTKNPVEQFELMNAAARMAVVSGEQVADVQKSLVAIVRQTGGSFADLPAILDQVAAAYQRTNIPIKALLETMAEGAALKKTFGLSGGEFATLVGATSEITSKSADQIRAMFGMAGERMYQPSQATQIWNATGVGVNVAGTYGQERRPVYDVLNDVAAVWHKLNQTQKQMASEAVTGVRNANYAALIAMLDNWSTVQRQMEDSTRNQVGAFNQYYNQMADTFDLRVKKMAASWQGFLASLTNIGALKSGVSFLGGQLNNASSFIGNSEQNGALGWLQNLSLPAMAMAATGVGLSLTGVGAGIGIPLVLAAGAGAGLYQGSRLPQSNDQRTQAYYQAYANYEQQTQALLRQRDMRRQWETAPADQRGTFVTQYSDETLQKEIDAAHKEMDELEKGGLKMLPDDLAKFHEGITNLSRGVKASTEVAKRVPTVAGPPSYNPQWQNMGAFGMGSVDEVLRVQETIVAYNKQAFNLKEPQKRPVAFYDQQIGQIVTRMTYEGETLGQALSMASQAAQQMRTSFQTVSGTLVQHADTYAGAVQKIQTMIEAANPAERGKYDGQTKVIIDEQGNARMLKGVNPEAEQLASSLLAPILQRMSQPAITSIKELTPNQLGSVIPLAQQYMQRLEAFSPGYTQAHSRDQGILMDKNNQMLAYVGVSSEALRLALQELTDVNKGQLRGQYNVPRGYQAPTVWDYYHENPDAPLGPINYPDRFRPSAKDGGFITPEQYKANFDKDLQDILGKIDEIIQKGVATADGSGKAFLQANQDYWSKMTGTIVAATPPEPTKPPEALAPQLTPEQQREARFRKFNERDEYSNSNWREDLKAYEAARQPTGFIGPRDKNVGDYIRDFGDTLGETGESIGTAMGNAGQAIGQGAKTAGDWLGNFGSAVGGLLGDIQKYAEQFLTPRKAEAAELDSYAVPTQADAVAREYNNIAALNLADKHSAYGAYTRYTDLIDQASAQNSLPKGLLLALLKQENSAADPYAVSSAGAMGLGQLMPGTADYLGVTNPYDPAQSISGAARYLSGQLATYGGDVTRALVAYNGGGGAVRQWDAGRPYDESQLYVQKVLGFWGQGATAAQGVQSAVYRSAAADDQRVLSALNSIYSRLMQIDTAPAAIYAMNSKMGQVVSLLSAINQKLSNGGAGSGVNYQSLAQAAASNGLSPV